MRRDSVVFGISGIFVGLLLGWLVGSQQASQAVRPAVQPQAAAPAAAVAPQPASTPVVLDETRVRSLEASANANPQDEALRVQLGNMYFDAERFGDAIKWYEAALAVNPKDANVSTDLGVSYYYANQPDKALQQFEHSLTIDAKHTKTLLNRGIVRAFGKQDLEGAAASWQQVIELAPNSDEARAARQALDALKSANPTLGTSASSPGTE